MSDRDSRLTPGRPVQGELIPLENLPDDIFHAEENPSFGEATYTAQRFFSKRPEDYALCCTFLAGGMGLLRIARLLKVHHLTVAAVREQEGAQIDIEKERIRKNLRLAVGIASERLPEIMARLADGQVPLATAILMDKLSQMDGEPTQRVEHVIKGHLTHEAVTARIMEFPDAIEVPTVSPAATPAQKGLPDPASPSPQSDTPSGMAST